MIDDFDGDAAILWFVEGAGGVAVEGGLEGRLDITCHRCEAINEGVDMAKVP